MQNKKKTLITVSLLSGILLFTATAFADITAKSGYETFKSAIKNTAAAFTKQFDSFTFETMVSLKDNGQVIMEKKTLAKVDIKNNTEESTDSIEYANGKKQETYTYSDSKTRIFHSPYEDAYIVTEYDVENIMSVAQSHFRNPFEEERAKDMERVFDAVVGDLRNYVSVDEKDNESLEVFGSLNESQIPALANALASLGVKQFVNERPRIDNQDFFPEIVDEIYIKKVNGNADITKDNIVNKTLGTVVIFGKDKNGVEHELTIDVVFKLYDINSTHVTKPDLTGKEVKINKVTRLENQYTIDKRYLGKWKNEVTEIKDQEIIRKAVRFITINSVDNKYVRGSYSEQRFDGEKQNQEFEFEARLVEENYPEPVRADGSTKTMMVRPIRANQAEFEFVNSKGDKEKVRLHFNHTEIFLAPIESRLEHGQFYKVFE